MHLSSKDIEGIIKYPFQGNNWFVAVAAQGALLLFLSMFLVGVPFLLGFVVTHVRNGMHESSVYPGFDQWGAYWSCGLKLLVTHLTYSLPIFILYFGYGLILFVFMLFGFQSEVFQVLFGIGALFGVLLYPLVFVYALVVSTLQYAYLPLFAADQPIKKAFYIKSYLWPYLKSNALNILILYVLGYALGVVAYVGFAAFFVGIFFTTSLAMAIIAYGTGVIYKHSSVKMN